MKWFPLSVFCYSSLFFYSCGTESNDQENAAVTKDTTQSYAEKRLAGFASVELTADLSALSAQEKQMLPLLIKAAQIMDELYWKQTFPGNKDSLLNSIKDSATKQFVLINYGPWDILNADSPFVKGFGPKPKGAGFYPIDISKEALETSDVKDKHGHYSIIKKDSSGKLYSVPYHVAFKEPLEQAAALLKEASGYAEDDGLKKYLQLRADALVSDEYTASDLAWMDMKNNGIDIIIGPIESYEDKLYESRNAYEAYVLVKDKEWSKRLAKYVAMLPGLQKGLPVDEKYKQESPGTSSELNAYNVIYYAGDCNSGSKTIAVNLPNDEEIQKTKGTRRSQLKNAMKAKFDKIMIPIANEFIDPSQLNMVQFDAFFSNVMFHEVAHGLGIKTTINGKGTVRNALQEQSSWLEEAKADILGLYMISKLVEQGELDGPIENYYTTFMAGILRSVRFGAGESHGKANMLAFNFFNEQGAFEKTTAGHYKINFDKFRAAMNELSNIILTLQGNGDKVAVAALLKEKGVVKPALQEDLNKLQQKGIPVDITFLQGTKVLGLE
ncbi:MAG: Zn-dependent hydrolase [Bacteroidota bacterium]